MAGALLFNPDRAADPMAIARAFIVLFLPYSLLGPFAGALMDRWDRRLVLVGANRAGWCWSPRSGPFWPSGRASGHCWFSAARQRLGPFRHVRTVGVVAPRRAARTSRNDELGGHRVGRGRGFSRRQFHAGAPLAVRRRGSGRLGRSSSSSAIPVAIALLLSWRFAPGVLGPDDTRRAIHGSAFYAVVTGWLHGARTVVQRPTVAATLSGLAAHRMVVGINSLVLLVLVHHCARPERAGWESRCCSSALGPRGFPGHRADPTHGAPLGALRDGERCADGGRDHPDRRRRAGASDHGGVRLLLGMAGQVVKLCADSAMQIDVDDALRGHVFAVQDALFWVAFIVSIPWLRR